MISVVIPLYNKAAHIVRAIESVLHQTYPYFELIVVDDGSTDQSVEETQKFKDPRIRIVRKSNGGVSSARNRGIEEARGELVAFLDADDAYKPDFLNRILNLEKTFPRAGAFATQYEVITSRNEVTRGCCTLFSAPYLLDLERYFDLGKTGSPVWSSAVAVRKSVFKDVGNFPEGVSLGEDIDLWIRIVFSFSIAFDPQVGATYFQDACERACVRNVPSESPHFFYTLTRLCAHRPLTQIEQNVILEFKNAFILLYAMRQIEDFSPVHGRKTLYGMKTNFFFIKKWEWIIRSFLPRQGVIFLRGIKRLFTVPSMVDGLPDQVNKLNVS